MTIFFAISKLKWNLCVFLFKNQRERYGIITVGDGFVENLILLYLTND